MQDLNQIQPNPDENEDTPTGEAGEMEVNPGTVIGDETSESQELTPGNDEIEAMEEKEPSLTEDKGTMPEFEPIEPEDELLPEEEAVLVEAEVEEESKARQIFRRLIRWTAGLLIIFGLGFITAIFTLYRPAVQGSEVKIQQLNADINSKESKILDLQNQISDLNNQIAELMPLEKTNNDLLATQVDFQLHVAILDARVDIATALLSLKEDDNAQALVILDKTDQTLDTIGRLLEPAQRDVVASMTQRLELVMSEIDDDPYAAESDLDVLATNLLQLEDALFSD
jgi:cell division protein FtsL